MPQQDSTAQRVLQLLSEGKTSGEEIAKILQISRMAVSKAAGRLRDSGIPLTACRGSGYALGEIEDCYNEFTLRLRLNQAGLSALPLVFLEQTPSTNRVAKDCGVYVAAKQTGARGRKDRSFSAQEGGVYFSYVFAPEFLPSDRLTLTVLAAGVAVNETLRSFGVPSVIKWVNDVKVQGKKICGILSEAITEGNEIKKVIVGIGVNVQNEIPHSLKEIACNLSEYGLKPLAVATALIQNVAVRMAQVSCGNTAELLSCYTRSCETLGKTVRVRMPNGEEFTACAEEIDQEGVLIVAKDGERIRLLTGEIVSR